MTPETLVQTHARFSHPDDPDTYALRAKGDSMHPSIRDGEFVVVERNGPCVVDDLVAVELVDDGKMIKRLVTEGPDEVVLRSVNGPAQHTVQRLQIVVMHPVVAVLSASRWRSATS